MGNCQKTHNTTSQVGIYEFKHAELIGNGKNGAVFKGYSVFNRTSILAVKCIHKDVSAADFSRMKPILQQYRLAKGENVARLYDYFYEQENSKLYLISEYCAYGNLNDLISGGIKADPVEDLRAAITYCKQIIKGLVVLHEHNIVHGSLNLTNILLHSSRLKINDFGYTKLLRIDLNDRKPLSIYDAPELRKGLAEPDEKCDVWSLGIVMYMLVYKEQPIKVVGDEYVFYNYHYGKCAILDDLVKRCLEMTPSSRISMNEVKEHPLLQFDPQVIEYLPPRWAEMKDAGLSPLTAHKSFHAKDVVYTFLNV